MRNITDIYTEYKIMPNLALHQLRVAGVAMQICESLDVSIDTEAVVTACLLHDMGNIIKFKLEYFPEFLEPLGLEYWGKVQDDYMQKYGTDEHHASSVIAQEIGVPNRILELIDCIGFREATHNRDSEDFHKKIVAYADMRVCPNGIDSLEARFIDTRKRYFSKGSSTVILSNPEERISFEKALEEIEKQIFSHCKIKPEDITEQSTAPYVEKLKNQMI